MSLKKGQLVKSGAGHDKGDLLMVAGFEKNRVLLCDGKHRKLEKPKAKNPGHIEATDIFLDIETVNTNRQLRKTINKIANPGG